MYYRYYNLLSDPFRLSPDHSFCYRHPSYSKGRAYMEYALDAAEGFVVVTGKPGMGKTTLINDLLANSSLSKYLVASIVTTRLEADDLLRSIAYEFCLSVENADKATVIQKLKRLFVLSTRNARPPLLIVDEAQNLSLNALEELRLLTNMQHEGLPLLQIFLLGQDELRDKLLDPKLEQLRQRVTAATQLEPLSEEHTASYVLHRLRVVGWKNHPRISRAAIKVLHQTCHGVPRRINQFCSRWFLLGAGEERDRLTVEDARQVARELSEEGLTPGSLEDSTAVAAVEDDRRDLGEELFAEPEPQSRPSASTGGSTGTTASTSALGDEKFEFPDPLKDLPVRGSAAGGGAAHRPAVAESSLAAANDPVASHGFDERPQQQGSDTKETAMRPAAGPVGNDSVIRPFVEQQYTPPAPPVPAGGSDAADEFDDEDPPRRQSVLTRVLLLMLLAASLALFYLDWQTELKAWFANRSGDLVADIRAVTKMNSDPSRSADLDSDRTAAGAFPIAREPTPPPLQEAMQRAPSDVQAPDSGPTAVPGQGRVSESGGRDRPPAAGSMSGSEVQKTATAAGSAPGLRPGAVQPSVEGPALASRPSLQLLGEVEFGFDSSELGVDATRTLDAVASALKRRDSAVAILVGHTDNTGPVAYNRRLSAQRAAAVADYLSALGVSSRQLVIGDPERGPAAALEGRVPEPRSKRSVQVVVAERIP